MRLIEVFSVAVILVLFSSVLSGFMCEFLKIDKKADELRKKTDSLIFVSESFYNTCHGKGYASLEEWKESCRELWELEDIEWEVVENNKTCVYCGKWKISNETVEVYCSQAD